MYRKSHLYDVDAGPSGKFHESSTTAPGPRLGSVVHGTPIGSVGLTTCYDLRFPYVYSALRAAGADIVLVPSAFMPSTGAAHWHVLLRARAIEAQVYVGAAAQVGVHNGIRSSYGHALIVDPWGTVLADAEQQSGVVVADLDPRMIADVRTRIPVLQHRRNLDLEPVEVFGTKPS